MKAPLFPASELRFCHYCRCTDCATGHSYIEGAYVRTHAKTATSHFICKVCFTYECCVDEGAAAPCDDLECPHRPRLVSAWAPRKKP